MNNKNLFKNFTGGKLFQISILLLFLSLPFGIKPVTYALALSGIAWIISGNYRNLIGKMRSEWKFNAILAFILLNIIGITYSNDITHSLHKLEIQTSLLLLPLIFFSSEKIIRNNHEKYINTYIVAVFISIIYCYIMAFYNAYINADDGEFLNFQVYKGAYDLPFYKLLLTGHTYLTYGYFPQFIHVNYFAMYITMAVYLIYKKLVNPEVKNRTKLKLSILIIFLFITFLLLQSRSGIITLLVLIIFEIGYHSIQPGKKLLKAGVAIFLLVSIVLVITNSQRFQQLLTKNANNETTFTSENTRLTLWKQAFPIIKEHPVFGVGTGDAKEVYQQYHGEGVLQNNQIVFLNFHNEYLETTVRIGVVGLLVLLTLIFKPLFNKSNYKNKRELIAFTIIIAINFMFESMLSRLAGVVFFALFYCFLHVTATKNNTP